MFPLNIMASLLRGAQPSSSQVLTLTPGQMLQGEILKIFPDQFSLVRLGSTQVKAKLEAPLEVGQKSWFQVQSSVHPITLKLITPPDLGVPQNQSSTSQLLSYFGLPHHSHSEQLVQFFLQEHFPLTKDSLRAALTIIDQLGNKPEVLQAIKYAIQRGIPLLKETIQSLHSFATAPPLLDQLARVEALLPNSQRTQLQSIISRLTLDSTVKPNGLLLFLQRLGVQLESRIPQVLTTAALQSNQRSFGVQSAVNQHSTGSTLMQGILPGQKLSQNANALHQGYIMTKGNTQEEGHASIKEQPYYNNNMKVSSESGHQLIHHNESLQKSFESGQQQGQIVNSSIPTDSLKSFLWQQLQDSTLSKQVKESIQTLVHTLQGQQILMTADAQQSFQTYIFQAFYPFESGLRSIYGQISGKKNKNGQVDPENCRMYFHLSLQHLGATDIDVQIQSRYISLTFYSLKVPSDAPSWIKEHEGQLKEALQGLGYTLTYMKWKERLTEKMERQLTQDSSRTYTHLPYQGVDIRL